MASSSGMPSCLCSSRKKLRDQMSCCTISYFTGLVELPVADEGRNFAGAHERTRHDPVTVLFQKWLSTGGL